MCQCGNDHGVILKAESDLLKGIRSAVRGLFNAQITQVSFYGTMQSTITRRLTEAFYKGAAKCGIKPDELTAEEREIMQTLINSNMTYVSSFGADIVADREQFLADNPGKVLGPRSFPAPLRALYGRVDLWVGRYNEAVQLGQVTACKDKKLEWVLGEAEHCSSCLKLAGKVKRASFWLSSGIIPRVAGAGYLECRGYRCQCSLNETEKPLSKGPLPRLP